MADAKYVVGDHRNGDAKIELDANKKQFSGLSKEELLKYAEDPFWVNLRWFMFVLFWAMWLAMLAGAITIIIKAPKCAPPPAKTWYQKGPLVDVEDLKMEETQPMFEMLKSNMVQGIFIDVPTYEVLDSPDILTRFKDFVTKAKDYGIKIIVDLTPNYVSVNHTWFIQSQNRSGGYADYFVWGTSDEYVEDKMKAPNNWTSTLDKSAWEWNEVRKEFYLNQYGENNPDLNFHNPAVVEQFNKVIKAWMGAGANGVRLNKARQLLVNISSGDEIPNSGKGSAPGADHMKYEFWRRKYTSDLPGLDLLFSGWSKLVDETGSEGTGETVFTLQETGERAEWYLLERNVTSLRPPSAKPLLVGALPSDVIALAADINTRINLTWPIIQLKSKEENGTDVELAVFSMLLPAAPVLDLQQLQEDGNATYTSEYLSHVARLREDASVSHGAHHVRPVPHLNDSEPSMIACARAKPGHTGYLAVYNPTADALRANLTAVPTVPATVTIHLMSHNVANLTEYTTSHTEGSDNVLVPAMSTVVVSYVPVPLPEK